jgi:hypothetical protein
LTWGEYAKEVKMIINRFRIMVLMMGVWTASVSWVAAEGQPPVEGTVLPAITLAAPKDAAHQTYLGLAGKKQFSVADIPAEIVIVHIFNMY